MVVAGTDAAAVVLPHLARQLISLHAQRADVAAQVEALVEAHPLYEVLISMPGIGVRTAAVLAGRDPGQDLQAPAPSWPPTPGSLPSHAAPAHRSVARCVSHGGNKRLKRAMFLSAFASLRSDPVPRAYYQRKRDQGKAPWEAVLALAHRRILTLHAMIRNGALYDPQPATKLPAAA